VPTAARIARAEGAEIVLAHVVSEPPTTAILSDGDMQLARQLAGRMEASATRYLQNLRDQLEREGLASRAIVQRRTDVRQSLLDLVRKEAAHLVVLSAHGTTCNPVRSFGSVTAHLLEHASAPLLVLQDLPEADNGRVKEDIAPDDAPALRASYTADEA
jgi:nucleotide-binding universal stress UspA family protein